VCNGIESCNAAVGCVPGTAPICSDAQECTIDSCSPITGCLRTNAADGTPCTGGVCVGGVCS
jgi:hypothetical protein